MAVITISRQFGSGGDQIARQVCKRLDYRFFEKRLMNEISKELGLLEQEVVDFSEDRYEAKNFIQRFFSRETPVREVGSWAEKTSGAWTKVVKKIGQEESVSFVNHLIDAAGKHGNVVIVGRGGQVILRAMRGALHIRIIAPVELRIQRVQEHEKLNLDEARTMVEQRDRAAADYLKRFHGTDISDPLLYHFVLNTGRLDNDAAANIIVNATEVLSS